MVKLKIILIFILDVLIFFGALALTLLIRYGYNSFEWFFFRHLPIFTILFFLWAGVYYLSDLYQFRVFKNKITFLGNFFLASATSLLISVVIFYFFGGFFQITPKINLLIFSVIFLFFDYWARIFLNQVFFIKQRTAILFIGESLSTSYLINDLKSNPQLGYDVVSLIKENEINPESLKQLIYEKPKIEIVIISLSLKNSEELSKQIYSLSKNIKVVYFRDFFEMVYQKEPLELLDDVWFIEKLRHYSFFDVFKRVFDISLAFILLVVFSPIILICAFLIKISSPGSIFFKQKVFGRNNKVFILYKLRTMKEGSEYPLWTTPGDKRVTKIGRILRPSHLDEFPQLYNILRGDLSFAGPRPERIELAKIFEEKLPYYNIRRLVKPGLTGWAQINYKPSASIEEASEKLKYDFYYLKNRSFLLDLFIILKTTKLLIISPK